MSDIIAVCPTCANEWYVEECPTCHGTGGYTADDLAAMPAVRAAVIDGLVIALNPTDPDNIIADWLRKARSAT